MPIIIYAEPESASPATPVKSGIEVPVLQWPFRMAGFNGSQMAYVEQDSPEEVEQCVALLFTTRPGDLPDEPTFGLAEPAFRQGGVTQADLEAAVRRWEPRAQVHFTGDELVSLTQTLDIEVST